MRLDLSDSIEAEYDFLGMQYNYFSPSKDSEEYGINKINGWGENIEINSNEIKGIGNIDALLIDKSKLSIPLKDALDSTSDYSLFMGAFYGDELKDEAYSLLECSKNDIYSVQLLFLDRLYIHPEYRAKGFSNIFLSDLIENFAPSIQFSFLYAAPLQIMTDESREKDINQDLSQFRHLSNEEANERLINYYKKKGYKSFSHDKNLMIRRENF